VQSRFGYPGVATRYLISQNNFNEWANGTKPRTRVLTGILLFFVLVACSAAIVIMGPRLVREASLLWFGTEASGVIQSAEVAEIGKFKGGDPKYRLSIAYDFTASDGNAYEGLTQRGDIRYPPELKSGDPITIYYSRDRPQNSVADYNLRTDVYALLLFLPWIALFGILGPVFYFRRWSAWRRNMVAFRHAPHTTGV